VKQGLENYLTTQELAKRWRMSMGTLENWRLMKKGPTYEKKGWSVLYPVGAVKLYEKMNPEVVGR
jgi:hypothetical protein